MVAQQGLIWEMSVQVCSGSTPKILNQLGAKAEPVADEVRRMLESGKFPIWAQDLQAFLEKVKKGEAPGKPFKW